MSRFLDWCKTYPITLASIIVTCLSLVMLVMVHFNGEDFLTAMTDQQKEINRIEQLSKTDVKIPAREADQPEQSVRLAINQAAIDKLKEAYAKMGSEFRDTFDLAKTFNKVRHLPMADGLFPEPDANDYGKLYEAKSQYQAAFKEMLQEYSADSMYPHLDAGRPVAGQRVADAVKHVETEFLSRIFPQRELTETEKEDLARLKRKAVVDVLMSHAKMIHIYAETDPQHADYPFAFAAWSRPGPPPTLDHVWEGQMSLWIHQDIIEAIASVNKVEDPKTSVIEAPIKRLIKIDVLNKYIGIEGGGLLRNYPALGPTSERSADEKMPDDFSTAHTGRRSNAIYDVRHARVQLLADFQRLPEFLDGLAKVNFITVLKMDVKQIDEYEAMRQGYFYGSADVVQVDMIIESVWIRDWTKAYMPKSVRMRLGVDSLPQ